MNPKSITICLLACILCTVLVVPVTAFSDGGSPPDLVVSKIDLLSPLAPGGQVSVQVTCKNTGQAASGSFPIEGWIFSRPDYKFSMKMGTISAAGLGAGESATYTFSFTLPGNAPSGKYDIKVAADNSNYAGSGSITEANENNNEKWLVDVSGPSTPQGTPTPTPIPASTPVPCREYDFTTGNIGAVSNNPSKPLVLTFDASIRITSISNYHWNDGKGKSPGTIALQSSSGQVYGPWQARGSAGQGGVPDAYWTVEPGITLPAGTYTVVDSDPATWSHNSESGNRGMTAITYTPASCSGTQPVSTPTSAPVVTPTAYVPPPGSAADLWVREIIGPMTANAGSTISISASVGNNGNVATPAADLLYALVFTTDVKKAYVLGDSVTSQGFSAYASGTATRQVTIPDNVPPGNYYIGVWIDPDGKIPDSNPDNNLASNEPNFIMVRAPVVVATKAPVITQTRTPVQVIPTQVPVVTPTPLVVSTSVPVVSRTSTPIPISTATVTRTAQPASTPTPTITPDPVTGCYPLNGPMTITQSGTYCIDRDFSGLVKVKASDVTIKGNGHTISKSGEISGISAGDVYDSEKKTYTQLKGFTVEDVKFAGTGLSASNVDNIVVTRVTTSGINGFAGIYMFSCRGVTITDSMTEYGTLSDGRCYGIELRDVFDVVLKRNTLKSNTGDGVMLTGVSGLECTDNTFDGNSEAGLSIGAPVGSHISQPVYVEKNQDIHISDNTFRKNTMYGLGILDCPGAVIERNTFEEGGGGIVTWKDCTGMVIEDNIIRNNKGPAIIINYGTPGPCIIRDNIIDNNKSGEETSDGWGVTKNADGISLGGNGHTVTGNTITNNDVGIRIYWDAEKNIISNNKFVNRINFFAQGGVGPYGAKIAENTWNVRKTAGTNIMGGPYIGGNFWGQPDGKGFSQVTQDADGDGFCDHPYQLNEKNADALPLVDFKNPPKITRGSISVTSVPTGAAITLDGESRGVTPVTLSGILEGTHSITLKKSGYVDYTGTIVVKAGQTVQVDQKLTPVPPPTPTATKTPAPKPTSTAKPTAVVKTPTPAVQTPVATPTKQPTAVSQPTAVVIPTKTVKPPVTTLKPTTQVVITKTAAPPTQVPQNPCSPPAGSTFEERMAAAVFTETNKARAANGLPPLCWDPKIATVSKGFASAMAAAQNMPGDHNLPGNLWNDRSKTINGFGFAISSIRENIATGVSGNVYTDCNGPLHKVANTPEGIAEFVVDMWMNHDTCHNDGHRKNILASVTHIGVGVVKGSNGRYYIAQDFGAK